MLRVTPDKESLMLVIASVPLSMKPKPLIIHGVILTLPGLSTSLGAYLCLSPFVCSDGP